MPVSRSANLQAGSSGQRIQVTAPGEEGLTLVSFGSAELNIAIKKSWVSRCYGQYQFAPTATLTAEGKGTQSFASLIIPNSTRKPISIGQLAVSELGEGGFSIAYGKTQDIVLLGDQASQLSSGSLAATGAMAWLRMINGQSAHAGLVNGQELLVFGCLEFRSPILVGQCAIEFRKEWLEISVRGTRQFELVLNSPVRKVVINGSSFLLERRTRRAAFEVDETGWRLKLAQLGAS